MESDAERGVGSSEDGREELSQPLTIASLNRGMDSIVAKAGTLPTLKNVAGITSFERKFKSALEATPFGCYPSMLLDVYEGKVGWSETDMRFVEKGWRRVQEQKASTRTSSRLLLALSGDASFCLGVWANPICMWLLTGAGRRRGVCLSRRFQAV